MAEKEAALALLDNCSCVVLTSAIHGGHSATRHLHITYRDVGNAKGLSGTILAPVHWDSHPLHARIQHSINGKIIMGLNAPLLFLAEREGFEPSERVSVHLISSQAHSASLAPLLNYSSTDDASRLM